MTYFRKRSRYTCRSVFITSIIIWMNIARKLSFSWNIAESGVKHQKSNQIKSFLLQYFDKCSCSICRVPIVMIIDTSILSTRSHTVDFYNPDTTDKFQKCEIEGKNWITRALIFDRKLDQLLLKDSQTLFLTPVVYIDNINIHYLYI